MPLGPFRFMTSVEAVQLTGWSAANLLELDAGLGQLDGSVIYHHTHRFYRAHSFLGSQDRSDFSLWIGNNLKEEIVAERMGALDLRDYSTIEELRSALLQTLDPLRAAPERWNRRVPPGLEFHFCRSTSIVLPTGNEADNLEEFLEGLERVDSSCVHYHLIESPLHFHGLQRRFSNDFSQWLAEMGFSDQARAVAELDPYQGDLEALREKLIGIFRKGKLNTLLRNLAQSVRREPAGEAAASWLRRWRKED